MSEKYVIKFVHPLGQVYYFCSELVNLKTGEVSTLRPFSWTELPLCAKKFCSIDDAFVIIHEYTQLSSLHKIRKLTVEPYSFLESARSEKDFNFIAAVSTGPERESTILFQNPWS